MIIIYTKYSYKRQRFKYFHYVCNVKKINIFNDLASCLPPCDAVSGSAYIKLLTCMISVYCVISGNVQTTDMKEKVRADYTLVHLLGKQ
jgi:hypothetical protein